VDIETRLGIMDIISGNDRVGAGSIVQSSGDVKSRLLNFVISALQTAEMENNQKPYSYDYKENYN
jgi:hypothetical protein